MAQRRRHGLGGLGRRRFVPRSSESFPSTFTSPPAAAGSDFRRPGVGGDGSSLRMRSGHVVQSA